MNHFLISIITYIMYTILKYRKAYYSLQQNTYNLNNRYVNWMNKNNKKMYSTYELLILGILLIFSLFINNLGIIVFILYTLSFYLELTKIKKEQKKKKFVVTKRVGRLILTTFLIFVLLIVLIGINYNPKYQIYNYLTLFVFGYLSYIIAHIVNIINKPIEKIVYYYYTNKTKKKLNEMKNLKVIGITGSYGKTSSKNILHAILETNFNSYPTPKSFNTPYGLMNAVNNGLDKFTEVFIAEMGATKINDINTLCNLVHPKYGIITTIGVAHLESFKSEENVIKGKFELIESLPIDGVGILNMDDKKQVSYKIKNKCKIIWIGIENKNADYVAYNIKLSDKGTSFDLKINNKKYSFETVLLGKHNIYNILSSIALGIELGVSADKLSKAIKSLRPIEHRLELKKLGNMNIIDDAFNSNPVGSKMALEVLDMMPGKKVIITPGMIELGDKEYEYNYKFGQYISEVADEVILIGEKQTKPIYEGIISKKYNKKKIHILNNVKEAFPLAQSLKADYVLVENDLPDIFSEV